MRVLIAEDEPSLSGQLARALAEAGYAVDEAADGERTDFLARTEAYDAVVSLAASPAGGLRAQLQLPS